MTGFMIKFGDYINKDLRTLQIFCSLCIYLSVCFYVVELRERPSTLRMCLSHAVCLACLSDCVYLLVYLLNFFFFSIIIISYIFNWRANVENFYFLHWELRKILTKEQRTVHCMMESLYKEIQPNKYETTPRCQFWMEAGRFLLRYFFIDMLWIKKQVTHVRLSLCPLHNPKTFLYVILFPASGFHFYNRR